MDTRRYRGFTVPRLYEGIAANRDEAVEKFYQGLVGFARRLMRAANIEVTVIGAENLPAESGAMLAGNHTGYADFILMGTGPYLHGERLVRFMAKKSVFDVPVLGRLLKLMKHVPVDRAHGGASIAPAVEMLREGNLVGIFPEATISRSFELADFKTGAARIAHQAGVPLVPCVIWGSQRIWTKDLPKHFRNVPVIVRYGEPVHLTGDAEADTAELKRQMQLLLDASRSEYASLYSDGAGEAWMPVALGGTAPTPEEAEELYARERAEREAKKQRKKV
ncbi:MULTISPECIES: 1-acyl-sn-glycerol-3-phosphate acyltransferase [Corynebacterium]|uniref:1-acyl-sn-glycerol-3-phosphate acyltransferase n=1 Tax=Corynebacterium lehmanniae TaxID=2913497 RepID=A0ABT4R9V9_9CORY|nr:MULTISPECIES: lysophospholipid acyltransferase family protein [Corynebacterium]MCG7289465.1 1-acyl-sn-glycerol-3-phosphate acyltransferase [Corynebacterium sp. ACRPZ]MCG7293731.1 1-acyl-sn-glycerol-3-phosphate acyltransferase [Corynebacterium sp. ACRPY]MCZ9292295.1 1-acyl-sn-glycerol-3-phosphate acyltransferase [Corynebacterium lehmanniae]